MSGPRPDPARHTYLGYRGQDSDTPFGRYFRAEMAPLAGHVLEALSLGPQAPPLLGDLNSVPELHAGGYLSVESGYVVAPDGSIRVAVLTPMPGVSAEMWDWWFGWHGSDTRRYKLWHPRAHLHAEWGDGPDRGRRGRERYVGRTSFVDEYLGSTLAKAAIQFIPPALLGADEATLVPGSGHTMICARLGSSQFPVDIGYLVHHVRPTSDGCEMRSRFFLGGRHVGRRPGVAASGAAGAGSAVLDSAVKRLGSLFLRRNAATAAASLLVHCAQEMAHLASFLAELHEEFSPAGADQDA